MAGDPKVILASMPWAPYQEPSHGLAILSSVLDNHSIENEVKHLNIQLLRWLKASSYQHLANLVGTNEFFFSQPFEEDISADQLQALDRTISILFRNGEPLPSLTNRGEYLEWMLAIRNEVIPKYLVECANEILDAECTMLGLTCMFDQTIASLALAKLVKAAAPDMTICLGGYALEGVVGQQILRCFDFVDVIAYGDGEPSIASLAAYSVGATSLASIPNLLFRTGGDRKTRIQKNNKVQAILDESPIPNYAHYFSDIKRLGDADKVYIKPKVLPLEASRGCWWGQKNHCIFCGIDKETLKYRQKSPNRVDQMFSHLREKYGGHFTFRLSDYILPHSYYKTVLPKLSKVIPKYKISCEMKANISIEKFELMRDAGFEQVQPGIESFSTDILMRMRKGVTGIQNILTLKLGRELGIQVDWNLLYGFPGDKIEEYQQLLRTLPQLYHLDPPHSCTNVLITRFAPLQTSPSAFGIEKAQAHPSYDAIFSRNFRENNKFDLNDYCYIFQPNWDNGEELEAVFRVIDTQVEFWKGRHKRTSGTLRHTCFHNSIVFEDGRQDECKPVIHKFSQAHRLVYEEMHDRIRTLDSVCQTLVGRFSATEVHKAAADLTENRLIYVEGNRHLGLSLSPLAPT